MTKSVLDEMRREWEVANKRAIWWRNRLAEQGKIPRLVLANRAISTAVNWRQPC